MAELQVVGALTEADGQRIVALLEAHGDELSFHWDGKPIAILLREGDRLVGGLNANTAFGWLYVKHLAVAPELRGKGWGRKLMEEAERIAREDRCKGVWLTTYSFQAPDFYRKLGYEVFGTFDDTPPGQKRYFLRKYL